MFNPNVWGPKKPSSVMNNNMSPKTLSFEDECLDESKTNIRRICENGMQCPTRLAKDGSKCNQEHVPNHMEEREKVKQKWLMDQMSQKLQEPISRTGSPVPIIGTKFDYSVVENLSLTYNTATFDIKSGKITFTNVNDPIKNVNSSSIPISISPTMMDQYINVPKKEQKNESITVAFTSTGNNIKMNTSSNNNPSLIMEKTKSDDSNSKWETPKSKSEKKKEKQMEQMKEKQMEKKAPSVSNSPVPMIQTATPVVTNDDKLCDYTNKCHNSKCTFKHPDGYIPGSVKPNTCHNGDKCYNQFCKFGHPDGYTPKPNVRCLGGDKCHKEASRKNSCPFSHPGDAYYDSIPENTRSKKN